MNRRILLAGSLLVLASLACLYPLAERVLEEWELTPGAITPPVNEHTLYVCVTAEEGAPFVNRQEFVEIIPQGTKLIDSGRRYGPLDDRYAELYYKGQNIRVQMSDLGMCE